MEKINLEHIRYLNSINEDMKRSIFARSSIILAIVGVVLSIIGGNALNNWEIYEQFKLNYLLYAFLVIIFIFGILSAFFVLKTIIPIPKVQKISRIIKKQKNQQHKIENFYSSFSMFNHIVMLTRKSFIDKITNASQEDLAKDLLNSLYDLSHVIQHHYKVLYWASIYLVLVLIFFLFFVFTIIAEYLYLGGIY